MRSDALFRARMTYCGPRGIPLSQFLSWPSEDQENALEWSAWEARRYPDGTHPDEWDTALGGSRRAYHTHIDVHPARQMIDAALESSDYEQAGRGAHVNLAPGSAANCPRCQRELQSRKHDDQIDEHDEQ